MVLNLHFPTSEVMIPPLATYNAGTEPQLTYIKGDDYTTATYHAGTEPQLTYIKGDDYTTATYHAGTEPQLTYIKDDDYTTATYHAGTEPQLTYIKGDDYTTELRTMLALNLNLPTSKVMIIPLNYVPCWH